MVRGDKSAKNQGDEAKGEAKGEGKGKCWKTSEGASDRWVVKMKVDKVGRDW